MPGPEGGRPSGFAPDSLPPRPPLTKAEQKRLQWEREKGGSVVDTGETGCIEFTLRYFFVRKIWSDRLIGVLLRLGDVYITRDEEASTV